MTDNFHLKYDDFELLIDWFQFTIFPPKNDRVCASRYDNFTTYESIIPYIFNKFFGIRENELYKSSSSSINGYNVIYCYRSMQVMINSEREDMGVNILLTGCGCRDFETLGLSWIDLFDNLSKYEYNINRIDIAIDTFTDKYYTLDLLRKYLSKGACSSRFRANLQIANLSITDNPTYLGEQIQFGSKASDVEVTFYNKLLERSSAGFIVDNNISNWYRCELRFRHDHALDVFKHIYQNNDYNTFVKSILYYYIDFKSMTSTDKNITRRPTAKFWTDFLGNVDKLRLSTKTREHSIVKSRNWLLDSVSKTQFMVYFAYLTNVNNFDNKSIDLFYEMITTGNSKLEDKDLKFINDYRISNKLQPLTSNDIYKYLENLKEYILLDNNNA